MLKWILSLCCSLSSLRMSSGTSMSVSAGNDPSLPFGFSGKISLDGSGCVFLQMETRVCLSRVSTVAGVRMRSGRTRVTVNKALRATTVRLVKSLMMFNNLTTDHQTISSISWTWSLCVCAAIPELCERENGGCDHFCTVKEKNVVCSCAKGYQLADNGKSCDSNGNDVLM